MIIKGSEYDFRINFSYEDHITKCEIHKVNSGGMFKDDGMILGSGRAICDTRDRFVKSIGRKIALKNALNSCKDKSTRRSIWNGYFFKVRE